MTDGCVHLLYNSSWKFRQLTAGQLLSGQPVLYWKGRRYGHHFSYTCWITLLQQGGPPCWTSSLTFDLIGRNRPASLCSLAGRYDNPMSESNISPWSQTKNLATELVQSSANRRSSHRRNVAFSYQLSQLESRAGSFTLTHMFFLI